MSFLPEIPLAALSHGEVSFYVMVAYMALLLILGLISGLLGKDTASDYFLADRSIGSMLLLLTVFGTTMTAFALVGSTAEAYQEGIGVYGLMASAAGIVHSAVFFLVGIRLWKFGKKYGYMTQVQYFRDRFDSDALGYILFPILVALVLPYLLIGILGGGVTIQAVTKGAFPNVFAATGGGVPSWLSALIVCLVVLTYVFFGGVRGTTWANAFQTLIFMVLGVVAFSAISSKLGGVAEATKMVQQRHPELLIRGHHISLWKFASYMLIPLSVGMFPHLFQHWLTAKSAKSFRLSVIAHPICIMIVWLPCVLIGVWASSAMINGQLIVPEGTRNGQLGLMVRHLTSPLLTGLVTAGILAAIMSSLDSQFLCLGTMFTNDIVLHIGKDKKFSDHQRVLFGRLFIVAIVAITYIIFLKSKAYVFSLAIWCFSGFSALFPLVFASLYWKRTTKAGAVASILVAAITWLYFFRDAGWGANRNYLVWETMPVLPMIIASTLALVSVSLLTKAPSEETLRKFFPMMKKAD